MSITRRTIFAQLALAGFIEAWLSRSAHAQTYTYDALGRVIQVEHNGQIVTYTYDNAGNRTQVVRASSPPSPPPPLPPPPPT
ncbi:MAG TPA: RHS repeat protein, partial [Terricaulis sp.]|nr:RHS repeat protein [Terricaulis sp.]